MRPQLFKLASSATEEGDDGLGEKWKGLAILLLQISLVHVFGGFVQQNSLHIMSVSFF